MNIEVRGIGFPNKGAELMLAALVDVILNQYPSSRLVLETSAPFHLRAKYGVYQLALLFRFGINILSILRLVPVKLRHRFGLILPHEIDVIIDASGFAYGDQWGAKKAYSRLSGNIRHFKKVKKNRKVILLPQAFGPFNDKKLQHEMSEIIDVADLIFARDERSLSHLTDIKKNHKIHQAPDFTNIFKYAYPGPFNAEEQQLCFIPNAKMLEMKQGNSESLYVDFMASLLRQASDEKLKPFLLIHEGEKDWQLGEMIMKKAGVDVPMLQPTTAADVKAVIGQTKLVISSRFHGLVSALSQGIPVLATGWSHKYQMLLNDYSVGEYLFDEQNPADKAISLMILLMRDETVYQNVRHKIAISGKQEAQKTERMWETVFNLLDDVEK